MSYVNDSLAESMRQQVHDRIVSRVQQGAPFWTTWDAETGSWLSTARVELDPDTLHYSKQLIFDVASVQERITPPRKSFWSLFG